MLGHLKSALESQKAQLLLGSGGEFMGKGAAPGHGFQSRLSPVALQDSLSDMCFHWEVVNMPGEKRGHARSMFGQDKVITSTGPLWDNVLQNVIKAFIGVWEMSSFLFIYFF